MLQADGGTRTAAITGAYVALADAVTWLAAGGKLADPRPLSCAIAAVSVGVVDGRIRTDLPYTEDSRAEVDMNVVATDTGTLVEIQGTGEGATFTGEEGLRKLTELLVTYYWPSSPSWGVRLGPVPQRFRRSVSGWRMVWSSAFSTGLAAR